MKKVICKILINILIFLVFFNLIFVNENHYAIEKFSLTCNSITDDYKFEFALNYPGETKTIAFEIPYDDWEFEDILDWKLLNPDSYKEAIGRILISKINELGYTVSNSDEIYIFIEHRIILNDGTNSEDIELQINTPDEPEPEPEPEQPQEDPKDDVEDDRDIPTIIKDAVAKWYYVMRLIVIAFMLILLIFIGIKMALSTIASEKAVYKQMLTDWVVGMIIVFSIHYVMIFILTVSDGIVSSLEPLANDPSKMAKIQEEYQYGEEKNLKTGSEIETTLYESARTRAYSLKLTDGFTGMIIYAVLVYFAWKFALIYFRRLINIIILTLLAPAVSASYAVNKVISGKPKIFSTWLKEYIMNVIIQVVHVVIYVSFVSTALTLSLESIIGTVLAFVLLNFMTKADKILREIFKLAGGSGSLAGEMADHTGFKQLKDDAIGMKNAMMGGALTRLGMKATYGTLGKAAGKIGIAALSHTVAGVKNSRKGKENEAKEYDEQEQETYEKMNAAEEYLANDPKAIENMQRIENLETEKQNLIEEQSKRKEKKVELENLIKEQENQMELEGLDYGSWQLNQEWMNLNDELAALNNLENEQEKIENIDKQINTIENEIQEDFLKQQIEKEGDILATLKGNLSFALGGLVEFRDGKYRSKKVKTLKEGGVNKAFWRKTMDSKALRFKNNMKLGKLFGLDSAEEKVLKSEMKFWKNRIMGFGSLVAGFPMLVAENPLVGMALLANARASHVDAKNRRKRYRYRAVSTGSFTFKAFAGSCIKSFGPQAYHILEQDQLETLRHKKVRKEAKSIMKWVKGQEKRENKVRGKAQEIQNQYTQDINNYEDKIRKNISDKNIADIAFEQKLREKNVVNVGDGICVQIQNNVAMNSFLKKVKEINQKDNISQTDRVHMIQEEIDKNKNMIITEAITNVCEQKGITNIEKLELTDDEMFQINYHILDILEKQGFTNKDEIDLEKSEINEESISEVYLHLNANSEETNNVLIENLVTSSILEYMESANEKDVTSLSTDETRAEIYRIVQDKFIPQSSKDSYSVIEQLSGRKATNDEIELPEDIDEIFEENIKKVKKFNKRRLKNRSRERRKKTNSRQRS